MSTETLLRLYGIQQTDLETNRLGQLSERQRDIIQKRHILDLPLLTLIVAGWCIGFGLLFLLVFLHYYEKGIPWGEIIPVMAFVSAVAFVGIYSIFNIHQAMNTTEVHTHSGILQHMHERNRRYHSIKIDGKVFSVNHLQKTAFIEGSVYRVYYVKRLNKIVSAELINRKSKLKNR